MINKKGDVPITVLVLGVFVICSLALLSFYASSFNVGKSFEGVDLTEKMNSKINEYNFYKSQGLSDDQIKEILIEEDFEFEGGFFEIETVDEAWLWGEDEFLFSINYSLP